MDSERDFLLCGLQRKLFRYRSHEPGEIKRDAPDCDRGGFIASDVQKTVRQVADASQILDHCIDDFVLFRIGRLSLKQLDCERQRCERRSEFIRKRGDQVGACALLVAKISHVMKSDHRAERSAIVETQRCRLEQVRMIAAANVQTYFGLLFAAWISEGVPEGVADLYVVTIVLSRPKNERPSISSRSIPSISAACSLIWVTTPSRSIRIAATSRLSGLPPSCCFHQ